MLISAHPRSGSGVVAGWLTGDAKPGLDMAARVPHAAFFFSLARCWVVQRAGKYARVGFGSPVRTLALAQMTIQHL